MWKRKRRSRIVIEPETEGRTERESEIKK